MCRCLGSGRDERPGLGQPTTERTAKRWFGITPVRLDAIDLGNRVAIVATFSDLVRCRPCGPGFAQSPRSHFPFQLRPNHPLAVECHGPLDQAVRVTFRLLRGRATHHPLGWERLESLIGDVYADGRLDQAWPCASLRATVSHLPVDADRSNVIETLDDAAAAACRAALGALARGDSSKRSPRSWARPTADPDAGCIFGR